MLELSSTPFRIPRLILKVKLLSQRALQVLKNPAESEGGVHEFNDVQQNFQGPNVAIKPVPEVNVLHLWRSRIQS